MDNGRHEHFDEDLVADDEEPIPDDGFPGFVQDDEPEFQEPDPDDGPTEQEIEEMEIEEQMEQQEMIDRREI